MFYDSPESSDDDFLPVDIHGNDLVEDGVVSQVVVDLVGAHRAFVPELVRHYGLENFAAVGRINDQGHNLVVPSADGSDVTLHDAENDAGIDLSQ